jgi:hypothetical protein
MRIPIIISAHCATTFMALVTLPSSAWAEKQSCEAFLRKECDV